MQENLIIQEESTEKIEKAISEDQNAIPYTPMSSLPSLSTVVPLSLAGETMQAQYAFREDIPDVDRYLIDKLGYTSKYNLSQALAAEQADAVAMAIRQIELGKGFILADMAGIGKGRVNASIARFAKVNGYLPIFITEGANLFSAFYRDLLDVGGINASLNAGLPLILNGYVSGGFEIVDGEKIKKPASTSIVNAAGVEIIEAPQQKEIKQIVKGDSIPQEYDYLMLTYSQLSTKSKVDFINRVITKLDKKVVICMDECHNATGTRSNTGIAMTDIIASVQGVLFSSATFSKRPDNMYIYAQKTSINESPLGTKKLIEVIKQGGERLTENLASNLVSAQQMIRRERSYDNCNVDYNFMSEDRIPELFKRYDDTVKLYHRLIEFFSLENPIFYEARANAINRFAKSKKIELTETPKPKKKADLDDWISENEGRYRVSMFTAGDVKRTQFQFIETLLFSLKADFVAKQAIEQLTNNKLENMRTADKSIFFSNRKPVIAVRNTLEGVYANLGMSVGDILEKDDFSMYVLAIAKGGLRGIIEVKEVLSDDEEGKSYKEEIEILASDFSDNLESYNEIIKEIENIDLNIPLNPIDDIIRKIEKTPRPSWDIENGGGTKFFKVGEVTGRKFRLVQIDVDGKKKYQLELNPKPKNKATAFKKFNNGEYDVLLINESGSTGEDAHSSSKFSDQRPRVMIIHQAELDVNTEVQKRGRISRTGMVNYPSYVYAVSRIPSEVRRLLMLARKLRSLDANTTANQRQSSKLSTIRDRFGNEIEDVINKYGDEVLNDFLSVPDNERYVRFRPSEEQEALGNLSGSYMIETFVRNLELALSDEQEYFYNTINALYKEKKDAMIEAGAFDLETNIVDLKAAIKTRVEISKGLNTNPFNAPVFEEDDYVLAEDKPYIKEKVEDMVLELAKGQDPVQFYLDFIKDFKKHFKEVRLIEIVNSIDVPDYDKARDEMEKMKMEAEYNIKVKSAINRAEAEHKEILELLEYKGSSENIVLRPGKAALIPAIPEECHETDEDGSPKVPTEYNNARFVGIRLLNTAKEKYSPMNIEMIFCQLSGKPKYIVKPTVKGRQVIEWIAAKSESIPINRIVLINNWEVDPNKRNIVRLLTGNILGAYGIAKDITRDLFNYSSVISFLKFTTADGTALRLGIKINPKKHSELRPDRVPVQYPLNNKTLLTDLLKTPNDVNAANGSESFLINYDSGYITIHIFGGLNREIKGARKYYTKLYDDGDFEKYVSSLGLHPYRGLTSYKPIGSNRSVTLRDLYFQANIKSDERLDVIHKVFEYIYQAEPFNLPLTGLKSGDVIYNKPDIFRADMGEVQELQEGVYGYDTLRPYNMVKESVVSFSKFLEYKKTSEYGTVYLNRRASVRETVSYGLIPLNDTVADMVSDTFAAITSDAEKITLKESLNKLIQQQASNFQIGMVVQKALHGKVLSLKNIFGYEADDLDFVGDVFRRYANGEFDLPDRMKTEELQEMREKAETRPLNMDTAEEFIIQFQYRLKL